MLAAGKLDAIQPLLDAGARVTQNCEGSPPLTMAVCMGSHPSYERFALAASSLLLDAGAVPFERRAGVCFLGVGWVM